MKSVPLLSSQDGPGRVQLEGFGLTRNRKVEGFETLLGLHVGRRYSGALGMTTHRIR